MVTLDVLEEQQEGKRRRKGFSLCGGETSSIITKDHLAKPEGSSGS